ncbi:MAG: ZIP family metal transporter [Chitinispirillaceae bacterium]|nr:ZIP family metal transporter [Chitinispirillaceae bacterium]
MEFSSLLFGALAFISAMIGGLIAVRFRKNTGALNAFAAGILIAVALFDLLPEALELAQGHGMTFQHVMIAAALGFIFLLILERYISIHHVCEPDGTSRNVRHQKGGVYGALAISGHSFVDGIAIGVGFQAGAKVGIVVALAIVAHVFSDGINTVTVMVRCGNSLRSSLRMLFLNAAAPLLGAASTLLFTIPARTLVYILPFFAGGFLYLGASDLLPEAHERNAPLPMILCTLAGFLFIFGLTWLLEI